MTESLKILMLEDNLSDLELILRVLKKNFSSFTYRHVMNREQYLSGLEDYQPDLILSDNTLPQFDATEALQIMQAKSLSLPFILVTGTVSEEFAAGIIKLGADDYILKDRLTRLPAAIENAIRQRSIEKEKLEAIRLLTQSEENLIAIFENMSEGIMLINRAYAVIALNDNAKKYVLLNTVNQLTTGDNLLDFLQPARVEKVRSLFEKVLEGKKIQYDRMFEQDNGEPIWLQFSLTPVWKGDSIDGICITARDITERKKAEEQHRSMEREILKQRVLEQKRIARAIVQAQEKERNHIGQELHDNVNQILAGTKIYLDKAIRDHGDLAPAIQYPAELVSKCMAEIRQLSSRHVTPVKHARLKDLIMSLLDNLETNTTIKTELVYEMTESVNEELNINIYRIIQEQITNIIKHAAAKHVRIAVHGGQKHIHLTIADDGQGFDVSQKRNGIGISNMINRVELFDGTIDLESAPGKGCVIKISLPCLTTSDQ